MAAKKIKRVDIDSGNEVHCTLVEHLEKKNKHEIVDVGTGLSIEKYGLILLCQENQQVLEKYTNGMTIPRQSWCSTKATCKIDLPG